MSHGQAAASGVASAAPNTVLDREQIDALIAAAGVAGTREIIDTFWKSTDRLIAELRDHLGAADLTAAARTAHALKGSALNVGAMKLSCAARGLEDACKTGDVTAASARLSSALEFYNETVVAFDRALADAA